MMHNPGVEIEQWLIDGTVEPETPLGFDEWSATFDADRQVVLSELGAYSKLFLRPDNFIKRFYHTLYPLPVEDWLINHTIQLFDGFCSIETQLDLRFQANFTYAQNQVEILSEINEHIKQTYYTVIIDLINNALLKLQSNDWVRTGLTSVEQFIVAAVNEMLVLKNIQSQSVCSMKASFEEFPEVQVGQENIYLSVLKKSYQVTKSNREEIFRQEKQEQQQQLEHERKKLENLEKIAELERIKQAREAEYQKQLSLDEEKQQQAQLVIQARVHTEKLAYQMQLKENALQAELKQKDKYDRELREAERKIQSEVLEHKSLLQKQETRAKIERNKNEQASLLVAEAHKNAMQLAHEEEQEQLKYDRDVANKERLERQRMALQEKNYKMTRNSDIYLRREIELLGLDKQRMELQLDIQESKIKSEDDL